MSREKDKTKDVVKYLFEAGQLKRIRRSGWWAAGVKDPETVAEHCFRASVVGYMIGKLEGLNAEKIAMFILFHDIPEARINDLHKVGQRYIDFRKAEKKAFDEQVENLPDDIKNSLHENIHYLHNESSKEAVAAKDADLIECAMQAKEYLDTGYKDAQDWINNVKKLVKTKTAKRMIKVIEKESPNSWWKGLKNIKR